MATPSPNPLPSTRHLLTSLITTIAKSTSNQQNDTETSNPLSNTAATSQNTKSAFLTLHSLFPHDFLPALDLLDRGLVTRLILAGESEEHGTREGMEPDLAGDENIANPSENERRRTETPQDENHIPNPDQHQAAEQQTKRERKRKQTVVYLVRSAQRTKTSSSSHRSEQQTSTTSYEVRLKAWNCSCPAFAFAALPVDDAAAGNGHSRRDNGNEDDETAGYGLSGDQSATAAHDDGDDEIAWLGFGGLTREEDVPVCKHLLACVVAERCRGFEQLVEEREVGVEEVAGWAAGWGD
jgi:hypothetical protein